MNVDESDSMSEIARNGSREETSMDGSIEKDEAIHYVAIVGMLGGPFCGDRHGPAVYLENRHPHRKITAEFDVVFDNGQPVRDSATAASRSKVHIGCSYWRPDKGHVQHYVRTLVSAKFAD